MNPTFDAFLRSWPFEPWFLASLLLTAGVYLRGWLALHRRDERRWPCSQPVAFGAGLSALFLALASPIEPFTSLLLQVHMLQHVLLMMIAPPLLWLGAPLFPLLLGLPRPIRTYWAAPLFRWPLPSSNVRDADAPRAGLAALHGGHMVLAPPADLRARPGFGRLALSAARLFPRHRAPVLVSRHPAVSEPAELVALAADPLPDPGRRAEHAPVGPADVLRPAALSLLRRAATAGKPVRARRPGDGRGPDVGARLAGVPGAPLRDRRPTPVRCLRDRERGDRIHDETRTQGQASSRSTSSCPSSASPRLELEPGAFDLLRVPLLGRFLRWRHARLSLQVPLLLLAGLIVYDGLRGPPVGAMNLAGVLPWIHWRGLVVLGLLAAGNVFCMACPFMVPRTLARRWLPQGRSWPRRLRNKWLAVVLLAGLPLGVRGVRSLGQPMVDRLDRRWPTSRRPSSSTASFAGASFCKYVCPIGQFNFVQSLVSPLEIQVRDPVVCASCRTKDCIRGRDDIPGMRAPPVPAAEVEQHGLHVLPRLYPRLSS